MNNNTNNNAQEQPPKRAAFAGQWRTPETPAFAAAAAAIPEKLPSSTEDYVKALQEAYLRGAEAAAAMSSAASCPDLAGQMTNNTARGTSATEAPASTTTTQAPTAGVVVMPPMTTAATTAKQPPPSAVASAKPAAKNTTTRATTTTALPAAPTNANQPSLSFVPMPPTTAAAPVVPNPLLSNSRSMPNMSAYASQQHEEAKRQKRLARNRASARLRRLRKKNLVDAYETEVGLLEANLHNLQLHQWGNNPSSNPQDQEALVQALSMDRGQDELSAQERQDTARQILQQQLTFCGQLQELMQEQFALYQVAISNNNNNTGQEDPWNELRATLNLSPAQCQQIAEQHAGWQDEWKALQTIQESLLAMQENTWLWDEGVSQMAEQFMQILQKNQVQKFLLWADHNVEALEELDTIHAAPEPQEQAGAGPVLYFGVDSSAGLEEAAQANAAGA